MDSGLTFWDAFQTNSLITLIYTFAFCVTLGVLFWLYGRSKFLIFSAPVLVMGLMIAVAYESTAQDLEHLKALHEETMTAYERSERFPLFPREEYVNIFNKITALEGAGEETLYGFTHLGDVLESADYEALNQMVFLSDHQLEILAQYIGHCYAQDMVKDIWNHQLDGYPVATNEARSALEYAQARSQEIKTDCLTATATLSFLQ